MSEGSITLVDIKAPSGCARYSVDPQIPMSALMTSMITSVKQGGVVGLFGNSRDSVVCHRSLAASDIFSKYIDVGRIILGSYRSISVQLLFLLSDALNLPEMLEVLTPAEQALIISTFTNISPANLQTFVEAINQWKSDRITPEALAELTDDDARLRGLASLFSRYEQEIKEADFVDYPGASAQLVDAITNRRELVRNIVDRYQTIFVDMNGITNADGVALLKELVRAGINMVCFCPAFDDLRHEMAMDILPVAKVISVRSAA